MLNILKQIFGKQVYRTSIESNGFLQDATMKHADPGYDLQLLFSETVQDGNDIDHISLRDGDTGSVVRRNKLHTGEKGITLEYSQTPPEGPEDFVVVTDDGDIYTEFAVNIEPAGYSW